MCGLLRRYSVQQMSAVGMTGGIEMVVSPEVVRDEYLLKHAVAVVIGRPFGNGGNEFISYYGRIKKKYNLRIVIDYDDLLWDVCGYNMFPPYNHVKIDPFYAGNGIESFIRYVDDVLVSTVYLGRCFVTRFGKDVPVKCVPNYLPHAWYGHRKHRITDKLTKPVVVYGGSTTHYTPKDPGDFGGPWVDWMIDAVTNDRIELHMFDNGVSSEFFAPIADKVIHHDHVNSLDWGATLREVEGDFYLAPLAENTFNKCKSNLKLLEACASGMCLIGSSFEDGPYEEAHKISKIDNNWSVDQLQSRVDELCEPSNYNDAMDFQDTLIGKYWLENTDNLTKVLSAWCGPCLIW